MATKIYHLLDYTRPTANVYRALPGGDKKMKLDTRPIDHAYLQVTFTNKQDQQKTIRLKLNSNTIFQDEQIKNGILANEKFTTTEKKAVEFRHGVLVTDRKIVQDFLEASPQFEGFVGTCTEPGVRALYKIYDPQVEINEANKDFKQRLKAGNKISGLSLSEAQDMIVKLYGSYVAVPTDEIACQNVLVEFIQEADDEGIEKLLSTKTTTDQEAQILISKLIRAGILSFDDITHNVAKKNAGNTWVSVKQISSDLPAEQRMSTFVEYLTSSDGKPLFEDLKTEVEKLTKKKAEKEKVD